MHCEIITRNLPGAGNTIAVDAGADIDEVVDILRRTGAVFGFLHGSRAAGTARSDSDVDVAAWWGRDNRPAPWSVVLPLGVDLLVLDDAPLELQGRVSRAIRNKRRSPCRAAFWGAWSYPRSVGRCRSSWYRWRQLSLRRSPPGSSDDGTRL